MKPFWSCTHCFLIIIVNIFTEAVNMLSGQELMVSHWFVCRLGSRKERMMKNCCCQQLVGVF